MPYATFTRRVHFFNVLALMPTLLRQALRYHNFLLLLIFSQFLPMVALWLGLSRIASDLQSTTQPFFPDRLPFMELVEQIQTAVIPMASLLLLTTLIGAVGFIIAAVKAYQILALTDHQGNAIMPAGFLRPKMSSLVVKSLSAMLVLGVFFSLFQAVLIMLLPGLLAFVAPLFAIYGFSCIIILPIALMGNAQTPPLPLFKAIKQCFSLDFVAPGQSKLSCLFALVNITILFYSMVMISQYLSQQLFLQFSRTLFHDAITPLNGLGIAFSQFALLGKVIESFFLTTAICLLALAAAATYYLAGLEIKVRRRNDLSTQPSEG